MAGFRAVAVDGADGRAALDGYFAERADGWPGPGVYSPKHPDAAAFSGDAGVFVLLEVDSADGSVTLAGCGGIRRLPAPDAGGVRFEVKHLWVLPAHRGAGHGRALFDELERRARDFGATELVLDTNDSLEAAGALYRRSGYVEIEPYNDNPNATVWLRKVLTPTIRPSVPLTELGPDWWSPSRTEAAALLEELRAEMPSGHVLDGVAAEIVAVRRHLKDVVLWLPGTGQWAAVHLTYKRESDPRWPSCSITRAWPDLMAELR